MPRVHLSVSYITKRILEISQTERAKTERICLIFLCLAMHIINLYTERKI